MNINSVADNYEKHDTYKHLMERYNRAHRNEFYLEALWIAYAMIEDRTSAFLFHIGFVSRANRNRVARNRRKDIRDILSIDEKQKFGFDKLSKKTAAISATIMWVNKNLTDGVYQKELHKVLLKKSLNTQKLLSSFSEIDEWREERNQLTHALFVKNSQAADGELQQLAIEGYRLARILDNAVKCVKRNNNIRTKFNIQ